MDNPAAAPAPAPVTSDAGATPRPAPIPLVLPPSSFANPADAFRLFTLTVPVVVDGREFKVIGIRRFTVEQVAAITANFRDNLARDPEASMQMPIYVDEQGQDLSPAVLSKLWPDDADDLDRETLGFLPRRFRPDPTKAERGAPTRPDGSPTEP